MTDENLQAVPTGAAHCAAVAFGLGTGPRGTRTRLPQERECVPAETRGGRGRGPPEAARDLAHSPSAGAPSARGGPAGSQACSVHPALRAPPVPAPCSPGLPRKPPGTSRRTLQSVCGQVLWPQRPCHALPSLLVTVPSLLQELSQCLLLSSVAVRARHSVRPMPPAPTVRPALHARMSRAAQGFQSLQTPPLPAKLSLQSS